jgi:hypothetical protein
MDLADEPKSSAILCDYLVPRALAGFVSRFGRGEKIFDGAEVLVVRVFDLLTPLFAGGKPLDENLAALLRETHGFFKKGGGQIFDLVLQSDEGVERAVKGDFLVIDDLFDKICGLHGLSSPVWLVFAGAVGFL